MLTIYKILHEFCSNCEGFIVTMQKIHHSLLLGFPKWKSTILSVTTDSSVTLIDVLYKKKQKHVVIYKHISMLTSSWNCAPIFSQIRLRHAAVNLYHYDSCAVWVMNFTDGPKPGSRFWHLATMTRDSRSWVNPCLFMLTRTWEVWYYLHEPL